MSDHAQYKSKYKGWKGKNTAKTIKTTKSVVLPLLPPPLFPSSSPPYILSSVHTSQTPASPLEGSTHHQEGILTSSLLGDLINASGVCQADSVAFSALS
jgi:hypothetical protein